MPCFTTETSDYHALAVTAPPSMFRYLAVPHFRPVPFRSVPFREIVTTHLNSARAVMQPYSLLATRMTLTTQIGCLAGLHCMYMYLAVSIVPYKDVSHVHFDGARATGAHTGLSWGWLNPPSFCFRYPCIVPVGKYGLELIIPMGSTPGYTILICWSCIFPSLCAILKAVCSGTSLGSWTKTQDQVWCSLVATWVQGYV